MRSPVVWLAVVEPRRVESRTLSEPESKALVAAYGVAVPQLSIEPGRSISGPAGSRVQRAETGSDSDPVTPSAIGWLARHACAGYEGGE